MEKIPASFYKIRFSDCDPFGHLNNARYLDYFLNAREDHLTTAYNFDLTEYYQQGISWLVGSHEINYLKPANYNENVRIQTALINVSENSLLVEMIMTDDNQTHIKAIIWTKFIPVNVTTGRRENHPTDFMAFAKTIEHVISETQLEERLKSLLTAIKKS
ncbi:MAG: acyl-CoA thioesterase [Flavobacterium sp.]|nr:acyl-CoA thioesterase [Flavobacterium sp.]